MPALLITVTGGSRQVLFTAAEEALPQVLEQVTGKEHVDPGVAAAVETRQQHGNDEGHFWGERQAFFVSMCFYHSQQIPMNGFY